MVEITPDSKLFPAYLAMPGLVQELHQFQDAEDAQQSHNADHQQVPATREDKTQKSRQDGQQVHNSIEAGGVSYRLADTPQAQQVLNGEEDGKEPLDPPQQLLVFSADLVAGLLFLDRDSHG